MSAQPPRRNSTEFLRWLGNRVALAKSCAIAAAKREDHYGAIRFEHEHNALVPVLAEARAVLSAKAKKK